MKKIIGTALLPVLIISACTVQNPDRLVNTNNVERIVRTLSADDMQGRATFTPGIEKAANFIADEFKAIGLKPLTDTGNFRQEFKMTRIKPGVQEVSINGSNVPAGSVLSVTDNASVNWTEGSGIEVLNIKAGETFFERYRAITREDKSVLVLVDASHADAFKRLYEFSKRGKIVDEVKEGSAKVFVLGSNEAATFSVKVSNTIEKLNLANVVGMLPGKS
ncbi:MAG TPA: hypothetical protein VLZ28_01275, partial [Daejeonella sp.]|nr:hypothetical protein [Daejeonella sp.]